MGLETKLGGLAKTSKLIKALIYMIMCKKYVGIISFYRALLKTVRLGCCQRAEQQHKKLLQIQGMQSIEPIL